MSIKKRRLLITGSGGFILGNFIRQVFYHKKPYIISSLDRVRETHLTQNIYVNSDHSFYIADVLDSHILHIICEKEKPDIIIHGADESCVSENNIPFITNNIIGTQNIINECIKIGAKLILFSTDKVYGSLDNEKDSSWTEESFINPKNIYAASKVSAELLTKTAGITNDLKYNIIRLCNNYGPWQTSEKFIPKIIKSIFDENEISIYGQGNQVRDWIHVYDTCSALFNIIDNGIDGALYNITAKQEFTNLEVAQIVCNAIGRGHNLIKHISDITGNDFRFSMNNDKIKSIDWIPQYKFRDGITQVCQWYVTNRYVLKM